MSPPLTTGSPSRVEGEDEDEDERSQELSTIATIFPELRIHGSYTATISLPVVPLSPLAVTFSPPTTTIQISHFPPLTLHFTLPPGYPATAPPIITTSTSLPWIPKETLQTLTSELDALWEDHGRSPIIFTTIDHVQQGSDSVFGLTSTPPLHLPATLRDGLTRFDRAAKQEVFDRETYDCGICLEPRKGVVCHRLRSCGHVFCRPCLHDFFSACIAEGDVGSVACIDPACKRGRKDGGGAAGLPATLPPEELRVVGVAGELVARYETLKLKAALERDPETVWCPRMWCQAPSRESVKALDEAMKLNHATHYLPDLSERGEGEVVAQVREPEGKGDKKEKLQVCSKCSLAFCKVCHAGWHGDLQICRAKDAPPTEEELASEEYLKANTTPCPTCTSPVLKSHGCNHLICKCQTHFCYLCSAFLDPGSPYAHFNTRGSPCYMRLWEGEEGDQEDFFDSDEDAVLDE